MYTAYYWNNTNNENDTTLIEYLHKSGLKEEFDLAMQNIDLKGMILDLVAGSCWTSALISKEKNVQ